MADVVETIGSGGTHATIAAWLSAHNAKDMVALGNRYIGELIDQRYEVDAGTLTALNTGTRSATAYRWLRARIQSHVNRITANATPGTGGSFTLSVFGQTTAAIGYNATAASVQSALEALSSVGVGGVSCAATTGANLGVANAVVSITWAGKHANTGIALTGDFTGITGNDHVLSTFTPGMGWYRPERHTGPLVYVRWTGTGDQAGIRIDAAERYFRMSGFGITCEDPQEVGGGNKAAVHVQGDDFLASRMFVRISEGGQRGSGSAPFFYCYYIQNVTGNNADNATFLNCIAYGSRSFKGANFGFYWDNFSSNGGAYNCAAYSIRHESTSRGFFALTATNVKPRAVNCTAMDCAAGFGGLWESIARDPTDTGDELSVDEPYSCVSSDASLPFDFYVPRASANKNNVDSRTVHSRPEVQDMRPVPGSPVFGSVDPSSAIRTWRRGRDMSGIWTAYGLTPEDFDGVARPPAQGGYRDNANGWTIGAYHGAGAPLTTTAPTVEVKSIGSAGGRDYSSIQAFLDATADQSLVYQNKVVIGELYADSDFTITAGQRVIVRRCIADAHHYRELRPAAGEEFDPVSGFGVDIRGNGGTATGENNLMEVHEEHFRLSGPIRLEITYTGANDRRALKLQGDYARANGVFGKIVGGTGSFSHVFLVRSSRALITNCIAKGSGSTGSGANQGFNVQNCEFSRVYCCTADGIKGNGSGRGFLEGNNTNRVEISSCIAADCTTGYLHSTGANAPRTQSNNISTDATADGVGAQRNVSRALLFRNPSADDYRNLSGSPALKRGRNLTVRFSSDFLGTQRYSPFDCGAYEGLPMGLMFAAPAFSESRAFQVLFELVRTDGFVILTSDQCEPVSYRGRTYDTGSSFVATNRRDETKAKTIGVRALLSSPKITAEDLAAGRYRGARLREIVLGRYTFTQPLEENVYALAESEYDADRLDANFTSLSGLLDRNAGRVITVGCAATLGDSECLVDITPNTIDDVRVSSTIQDPRRKFNAETADISGSYADDYFGKGTLTVLTGLNAGIVGQVKSYVASTRTFELNEALPFALAAGDTFIVTPGCRLRYLLDCIGKHSNGLNYVGEPFMPGTDKSLATPTR